MKRILALTLAAAAMLTAGCTPTPAAVSDTTAAVITTAPATPDTAVPATTAIPETAAPPAVTADPFPLPAVGEGVWHIATADELAAALAALGDFAETRETPTLCITAPIALDAVVTIGRPIALYYAPDVVPQSAGGLRLTTRAEGEISVITRSAELLSSGFLTIDAPYCTLAWSGEQPADDDVEQYCNTLDSCTLGGAGTATLDGISFLCTATGKPYADCTFAVRGNVVTFGYPLVAPDADVHAATLYFTTDGTAPARTYDLRETHEITLTDTAGGMRTYLLVPERISYRLPVMQIYTADSAPILTKTDYVGAVMYIDGEAYPMQIRGRGNASWTYFPKKSYRIKLDDGVALFGLAKNRDWVLVSNYADKSLIRNCVAHAIAARLDGIDYNPTHILVNLYLNGEYLGVYTFADKIEEGNGRLDFSPTDEARGPAGGLDIGFLCEIGWDFEGENVYNRDYFDAEKVVRIYVKEPESDRANTPEFTYVKQYILAMERAIVSGEGWQTYIDLDSWVDWFIVTELTFNTESAFYRSCYLWRREGGKVMLGPVWDFDMAFGNHYGDIRGYDGWCTTESTYQYISENWMNYLMQEEEFTTAVKMRWNAVKDDLLVAALGAIDHYAALLEGSAEQNFRRWNILPYQIGAGSVNAAVYNTHEKQVDYLRDFVRDRWAYIDARLNAGD